MFTVGLTGNIASGKSAVAGVWEAFGAFVVDSDKLAREAVEPGTEALRRIAAEWGEEVLDPDRSLDRSALRSIVFRDDAARRRLESFVHPEVERLRRTAFADARSRGIAIAVADIPLLFEVGMEAKFDLVVLVDAPAEVREDRIVRNRGMSRTEARRMVEAQMPAAEKRGRADLLIENDGSLEALEARAREAWQWILAIASEKSTD